MAEERRVRTSPAQCILLDEIEESGVLYIKRNGRYDRTIRALARNGLVVCTEPDHSRLGQDGWSLSDAGKARFRGAGGSYGRR